MAYVHIYAGRGAYARVSQEKLAPNVCDVEIEGMYSIVGGVYVLDGTQPDQEEREVIQSELTAHYKCRNPRCLVCRNFIDSQSWNNPLKTRIDFWVCKWCDFTLKPLTLEYLNSTALNHLIIQHVQVRL